MGEKYWCGAITLWYESPLERSFLRLSFIDSNFLSIPEQTLLRGKSLSNAYWLYKRSCILLICMLTGNYFMVKGNLRLFVTTTCKPMRCCSIVIAFFFIHMQHFVPHSFWSVRGCSHFILHHWPGHFTTLVNLGHWIELPACPPNNH